VLNSGKGHNTAVFNSGKGHNTLLLTVQHLTVKAPVTGGHFPEKNRKILLKIMK